MGPEGLARRKGGVGLAIVLCVAGGCASKPRYRQHPAAPLTRPSLRPATDAATRPVFDVSEMDVRTLPPETFFYLPLRTTFQDIRKPIGQAMADLARAASDGKVAFAGPPTFVYRGATMELGKPFDLEIGFPVAEGTKAFGAFKVRALDPWRCAAVVYTGPVSLIDKAYDRLIPAMESAGLKPTDETREIYLKWNGPDAADNQTRVAVGTQ